jgi:glycosyltransferase involved in cell wall biosynthesis
VRIAVAYWSNRLSGGVGTYLGAVMPALRQAGHEVGLWHELDGPTDRPVIPVAAGTPVWSASALGVPGALEALAGWRPDLLYVHGLREPSVEQRLLDLAPAVLFAHEYYGTCITGSKTCQRPTPVPCERRFGWRCLAEYYPRRCGGLNPVTAVRLFRTQRERLGSLFRSAGIVTHSRHMREEYLRQGLPPARVLTVGFGTAAAAEPAAGPAAPAGERPWRLLFVGRMDRLKGGASLLQALPDVVRRLGRRVHVTMAGDGPERPQWERLAAVVRQESAVDVAFTGWLEPDGVAAAYAASHLLVVPSLWPEPLGLVGLEAGRHGLPAVAYDVGGIGDWLRPGVNGVLAPGDPPTAAGLSEAILACLRDHDEYARLREHARQPTEAFSFERHVERLTQVFEGISRAA